MINKFKWLLAGLIGGFSINLLLFSDGVFIERNKNSPTENSELIGPSGSPMSQITVSKSSTKKNSALLVSTESKAPLRDVENIVTLPLSIISSATPPLLENETKLPPWVLSIYGLNSKESTDFCEKINKLAEETRDLEAKQSSLITDENGNQYFKIAPFPEEGGKLRALVEEEAEKTFARFADDRCEVFLKLLFKTRLFDDFGDSSKEISLNDVTSPTGEHLTVFSVVKFEDGAQVSRVDDPALTSLMAARYAEIIKKHEQAISPQSYVAPLEKP